MVFIKDFLSNLCHKNTLYCIWSNVMFSFSELQDEALCDIRLHERLECSGYGTKEHDCRARGCCYDINFMMCYFPGTLIKAFFSHFVYVTQEIRSIINSSKLDISDPWYAYLNVAVYARAYFVKLGHGLSRIYHISYNYSVLLTSVRWSTINYILPSIFFIHIWWISCFTLTTPFRVPTQYKVAVSPV